MINNLEISEQAGECQERGSWMFKCNEKARSSEETLEERPEVGGRASQVGVWKENTSRARSRAVTLTTPVFKEKQTFISSMTGGVVGNEASVVISTQIKWGHRGHSKNCGICSKKESQWRVLSKEVVWADLLFHRITLPAVNRAKGSRRDTSEGYCHSPNERWWWLEPEW